METTGAGVLQETKRDEQALSQMFASGDVEDEIGVALNDLQKRYPQASDTELVDYLIGTYCPIVASMSDLTRTRRVASNILPPRCSSFSLNNSDDGACSAQRASRSLDGMARQRSPIVGAVAKSTPSDEVSPAPAARLSTSDGSQSGRCASSTVFVSQLCAAQYPTLDLRHGALGRRQVGLQKRRKVPFRSARESQAAIL